MLGFLPEVVAQRDQRGGGQERDVLPVCAEPRNLIPDAARPDAFGAWPGPERPLAWIGFRGWFRQRGLGVFDASLGGRVGTAGHQARGSLLAFPYAPPQRRAVASSQRFAREGGHLLPDRLPCPGHGGSIGADGCADFGGRFEAHTRAVERRLAGAREHRAEMRAAVFLELHGLDLAGFGIDGGSAGGRIDPHADELGLVGVDVPHRHLQPGRRGSREI